jgi:ATP-dependent Clp protease adaptor protein ClpS
VSYTARLERAAPAAPEPDADQEIIEELDWQVADSTGEFGRVVIHNDDVTPFDFVVVVLRAVFHLTPPDAERVTFEAHTRGQASVAVLPLEEAKYRVGKAHGIARQAGFPLRFTIHLE